MTISHKVVEYNVESICPFLSRTTNSLYFNNLKSVRKLWIPLFSQILKTDFLEAGGVFHTFKVQTSGVRGAYLCAAGKSSKF